jgi:hypothetical protein
MHNLDTSMFCADIDCTKQDCGAVALDSTGADISSSIVVVDVTPCATGDVCPACAITFAAAGLCQPGTYFYLYRSAAFLMLISLLCVQFSLIQHALGSSQLQPA